MQAERGKSRSGTARLRVAGCARHGWARSVPSRSGRARHVTGSLGSARRGPAKIGAATAGRDRRGWARRGLARQAGRGRVRQGSAGLSSLRQDWRGWSQSGPAWQCPEGFGAACMVRQAGQGIALPGPAMRGRLSVARRSSERRREAARGRRGLAWRGQVAPGPDRQRTAGSDGLVADRLSYAWIVSARHRQARIVAATRGLAEPGPAGTARRVRAWPGKARWRAAGLARRVSVRQCMALRSVARQARQCKARWFGARLVAAGLAEQGAGRQRPARRVPAGEAMQRGAWIGPLRQDWRGRAGSGVVGCVAAGKSCPS
jgi:hypothetical protein